ncbi:MAG: hypothetical protein QM601_13885, partial [Pseudoxanthomonas sp.]
MSPKHEHDAIPPASMSWKLPLLLCAALQVAGCHAPDKAASDAKDAGPDAAAAPGPGAAPGPAGGPPP